MRLKASSLNGSLRVLDYKLLSISDLHISRAESWNQRFVDFPCGLSLLSHGLEKDDRHRRRQVQAACSLHRDRKAIFLIRP